MNIKHNLLSYVGNLGGNEMIGWLFIGFSAANLFGIGLEKPNLTHAILWLILAKLFWIHADIKER